MKFTIEKELFQIVKNSMSEQPENNKKELKVLAIQVFGLNKPNQDQQDATFQFLAQTAKVARKELGFTEEKKFKGAEWNKLFTDIGFKTDEIAASHINQQKRILESNFILDQISNITPLINILNAFALKYGAPIGGHNLNADKGDITVARNSKDLPFTMLGTTETIKVHKTEIVYMDEEKVLTRGWVWKQCNQDKSTAETRNVLIPMDFITDSSDKDIEAIGIELLETLKGTIGFESCKITVLTEKNNSVDFEKLAEVQTKITAKPLPLIKILRDTKLIERILNKAVEEILPDKSKLERLLNSGLQIKLYQGFDPTAPTLHIGHTVMMRKLEDFRKLGHKVFMLIGDFTGRIGDPSDKKAARKKLTPENVNENLKLYSKQASSLLSINDKENPVEVVFNNDWLGKLSFAEVVELASHFTVQQMMKRNMFQARLEEDKPIFLNEFLYPLMQGYDSVVMDVDIELGGNDQLFNMLAGRVLQTEMNGREKFVIAGKLLTTADGKKMGKSEGNMITLADSGNEIYGKVMAFTDEQILGGFELLTNTELEEVAKIAEELKTGKNPMNLKKQLAWKLVSELKSATEADEGQKYFEDIFQNKVVNVDIPEVKIAKDNIQVLELLIEVGFAKSKSDARRLIEQGAVKIDEVKVENWDIEIGLDKAGSIIRAGKRIVKALKN